MDRARHGAAGGTSEGTKGRFDHEARLEGLESTPPRLNASAEKGREKREQKDAA
jgi:hypothetical protein